MARIKFLRRDIKLKKFKRKKNQKWNAPKGRHNKMKDKQKGKPRVVSIGYGNSKDKRGKVDGKELFMIKNVSDLGKIGTGQVGFIGKVGGKKKLEIVKEAEKQGIKLKNSKINKNLKIPEVKKEEKVKGDKK